MPVTDPVIHIAPGAGDMPRFIRVPRSGVGSSSSGPPAPTTGQGWPR